MSNYEQETGLTIAIIVTTGMTAATFVSGFANYVAEKGNHVVILADAVEPSVQQVGRGTVTMAPVAMERNPSPVRDIKSLIAIVQTLKTYHPQIITYATPKASLLGSISGILLRVPTRVYQLWGLRLETVYGLKRIILWLMELLTSLSSTSILANSHSLATRYKSLGLAGMKKVDVLGEGSSHGVDLERFCKDASLPPIALDSKFTNRDNNRNMVLGFIGRLHPDKGIDVLLDALRILRSEGNPVKLLIVGRDEGAKLDLSGGIEEDVTFVGHVTDTRPYYSAMDVLVLPSLREGFPNVVLEAAAMSVPAIVSDGTGVVDSVIAEKTGMIIPVGDACMLAEKIRFMRAHPEVIKNLGIAARARVENSFDQKEVWNDTFHYLMR